MRAHRLSRLKLELRCEQDMWEATYELNKSGQWFVVGALAPQQRTEVRTTNRSAPQIMEQIRGNCIRGRRCLSRKAIPRF